MSASALAGAAALAGSVRQLAAQAGAAILGVYHSGDPGATRKQDDSPLTAADLAAHRIICSGLAALTPDIPVLSEEAADIPFAVRSGWSRYWLVDPLDGTREFLSRNGEFTVNIALVEHRRPVLGVVHVPVTGVDYWGIPGQGSWRAGGATQQALPIRVSEGVGPVLRVVGSRSHRGASLDAFLERLGPGGCLSPARADLRMGHGRRAGGGGGGRGQGAAARRTAPRLQLETRTAEPRLHRVRARRHRLAGAAAPMNFPGDPCR